MISIKSDSKSYGIKIPTDLSEIEKEYFEDILKAVKLPDNYSIVAICIADTLFGCVNSYKNNSNSNTVVVPLLAKTSNLKLDVKVGDRLFVSKTDLERSLHLSVPNNVIGYDAVGSYCSYDNELYTAIQKGTFFNNGKHHGAMEAKAKSPTCWFVEFKIVPNCDIKAGYDMDDDFNCMYKFTDANLN